MGDGVAAPESDANREYHTQQQLMLLEAGLAESLGEKQNAKLLEIARNAGKNREQPRVKLVQRNPAQKRSASGAALDAGIVAEEKEEEAATLMPPFLPPGMTMDRLPSNIKNFVLQHFQKVSNQATPLLEDPAASDAAADPAPVEGISNENGGVGQAAAGGRSGVESAKTKKPAKAKFVPKPPPGPPPESALPKV